MVAQYGETANRIIEVGEKIFAEKGLDKATIRDVAKGAGVGIGTIYQYFSDKHSLLFGIPALRIQEIIEGLRDSMHGAVGGFNKLRKFSYFLLNYLERNSNFAKLIYLVVMPYEGWKDSPSYELAKSVSDMLIEVVKEGQAEGLFRTDIDARLLRSAYLGAVERLTISWLLGKKKISLHSYSDDLTDLFIGGLGRFSGARSVSECPFLGTRGITGKRMSRGKMVNGKRFSRIQKGLKSEMNPRRAKGQQRGNDRVREGV